ncbi:FLT3 [Branchiostoma lanceolatum]|uniref:receptor protein-tyrosine kinase n=2 Tax=Branchiostoma lanceolatum TaxID=7740 RepID=A0A8K0ELN8_BRALA|nr:FLT3 [Branchiostoma lanceolatum]
MAIRRTTKLHLHLAAVGAENSYLNEVACVAYGKTYFIEVIVTACPIGRFGRFCMERCQCYNGASCHSFNGACKCTPGWRGRNCTIENPEVRISPSSSELTDLRYGQELQFNCTAYKFPIANIAWFFEDDDVSVIGRLPNVTEDRSSTVLFISSLLPQYEGHVTCEAVSVSGDKYNDVVDIRITGPDDAVSQSILLSISLTSGGVVFVLLIAIFLLHRQNQRMRVGTIDDPEVFKLGQNLQAVMPRERGPSSISIDIDMLKEREIDRNRLQIGQLLGEGAFGHVVKATLEQPEEGDVVVAVKKLKDDAETTARTALLRETCIMLLCGDHDHVIGLKGICFRDGQIASLCCLCVRVYLLSAAPLKDVQRMPVDVVMYLSSPLQLVLEYAEHGSLLHLLWTLRAESKTNMAVLSNKRHIFETMMVEVCSGLEHLASSRDQQLQTSSLDSTSRRYGMEISLEKTKCLVSGPSDTTAQVTVRGTELEQVSEFTYLGSVQTEDCGSAKELVHRDIAARNILVCGRGTAKIADFGLARDAYAVGYHRQERGNDLLPLKWMAPEGLKNEATFTPKSDVWSFGVLMWEVAQLGRTPYPGMDGADRIYDALRNHFRLPQPRLCTEERYRLMQQCWKFNEKNRPDATTVRKQLEADPNGFFYFNVPVAAIEAAAPVTPV